MSRETREEGRPSEIGAVVLPSWLWIPIRDWMGPEEVLDGITRLEREPGSANLRVVVADAQALVRLFSALLAVGDVEGRVGEVLAVWTEVPVSLRAALQEEVTAAEAKASRREFVELLMVRRTEAARKWRVN